MQNSKRQELYDRVKRWLLLTVDAGDIANSLSNRSRRIFIINLFCLVGVLFTAPLGIMSLLRGHYVMGISLLCIAMLYLSNHLYLRKTRNYLFSANVILYPLYSLILLLVYSGGINGTGHVWVYCIPPVSLFLHGLKRGLLEVLVFLIALVLILYLPNAPFERYDYHPDLKSRIVYSFVLIAFLSVIYEYISSRFNHSLSELSKQLELAATTDPLTNLLNRRGVMQHFSERDWHSPAMLLLDIDHFKRINDQYGHDHGDAYLRLFAKTIETHLADYHCLISRWGGEEFVVILESEVEKMRVAEGLREEVSKLTMPIANDEVCTTVSIGVTVLKVGETISRAFNRSDNALYEAKLAGRNQVMFEKAGDETAT